MRRAISPVIATVILIAITIVIGAAVGGWLLGLWGGFGDVEAIRIYPDTKLTIYAGGNGSKLDLTLRNEGTRDARIVRVLVEGVGKCSDIDYDSPRLIGAGKIESLKCTIDAESGKKFVPGTSYVIKVLTESGGVYQVTIAATE